MWRLPRTVLLETWARYTVRHLGYPKSVAEAVERVRDRFREEGRAYAHGEERPLAGYARVMATYGVGVAGLAALVAARRRPLPERPTFGDLALMAIATAKVSRLVSRDVVTSPLRAPFTRYESSGGPAELNEEVRGGGVRHAVGELLTCPFCTAVWVAGGLATGLVFAPRLTRFGMGVASAIAGADFLHLGYDSAKRAAAGTS
jgi:hypothetical protein